MSNTIPTRLYSLLALLLLALAMPPTLAADAPADSDIAKTVIKMPLAEGVTIDDAVESMKLRANLLNFKLVSEQPLSEQLKAMGVKNVRRLEIYQFCNPETAYEMVRFNMAYAAYLPCRIAVVEDEHGKGWLVMMNPERLMSPDMPAGLKKKAEKVVDTLKQIMKAGANAEL
ncbi:MAG: DUF302 domain-containing protein [Gammaproteobacteria bacterium]|jgi:uncharacterized protein (DUF302 family)